MSATAFRLRSSSAEAVTSSNRRASLLVPGLVSHALFSRLAIQLRGRSKRKLSHPFRDLVGPILGPLANVVALAFTAFTTVFFVFPPTLPVTGSNMNCKYPLFDFAILFSFLRHSPLT